MKLPESINYINYNETYTIYEYIVLILTFYTLYVILFNLFLSSCLKKRIKGNNYTTYLFIIFILIIGIILLHILITNKNIYNEYYNYTINVIQKIKDNDIIFILYDIGYIFDEYKIIYSNLILYVHNIYVNYNKNFLYLTLLFLFVNPLLTMFYYLN